MKNILLFLALVSGSFVYSSHHLIVLIQAKPAAFEKLKQELKKVQELSLKEKDCLRYEILQSIHNPYEIILDEVWTNPAAHALQFEKEYIKEFCLKLDTLLEMPYVYKVAHPL